MTEQPGAGTGTFAEPGSFATLLQDAQQLSKGISSALLSVTPLQIQSTVRPVAYSGNDEFINADTEPGGRGVVTHLTPPATVLDCIPIGAGAQASPVVIAVNSATALPLQDVAIPASQPATPSQLVAGLPIASVPLDAPGSLLPVAEWPDVFTPRFILPDGSLQDGTGPDSEADVMPCTISRIVTDEETGIQTRVEAVDNEVLVNFHSLVPEGCIRRLFAALGLEVLHSCFEPHPTRGTPASWFHLGILPASRFYGDVRGLLEFLDGRPEILRAGYNDALGLCAGLYPDGVPDDPLAAADLAAPISSAFHRVALAGDNNQVGAWNKDAGVEFFDPANTIIGVVVADTGVDVDHEDFLRFPLGTAFTADDIARARKDEDTQIYTRPEPAAKRRPPEVGLRHGLVVGRNGWRGGPIQLWEAPSAFPVTDRRWRRAKSATSAYKKIDIKKEWHGHGTAMAGLISAAGGNGRGCASFGTNAVRVMSARMRMLSGGRAVDAASVIGLVNRLRTDYGAAKAVDDLRVVFMGFAVDLPRRSSKIRMGASTSMQDLYDAMVRDREAGNDRVFVAPASNLNHGNLAEDGGLLSYPAAILRDKAVGGTAPAPGASVPTVIGVTAVAWSGQSRQIADACSFCVDPRPEGGYAPDFRAYAISGVVGAAVTTTDVRDRFYGIAGAFPPAALSGQRVAGYNAEEYTGAPYNVSAGTRPLRTLTAGNSIAAAQIASLAGILMSKWTGMMAAGVGSEADRIAELIRVSTSGGEASVSDPGSNRRRVPGTIDFKRALLARLA